MIEFPTFKPHFHVEAVKGEGIFLLTEQSHSVLTGRIYELVAPLVDGLRSADDIVDVLSEELSPAKVYYALSLLEKKGYIMEKAEGDSHSPPAFWTGRGLDPQAASQALKDGTVTFKTFGPVDVQGISQMFSTVLAGLGIQTADNEDRPGDLTIVITDDYLRNGLDDENLSSLENNTPWLLVKPFGREIFIGPLFVPGTTGCWTCLETRYRLNRDTEQFLMDKTGRTDPFPLATSHNRATLQIGLNMAAVEISQWLACGNSTAIGGKIISLDTQTWESRTHHLTRRSQCLTCGDKATDDPKESVPVQLKPVKVGFRADGGHRKVTPEETIETFGHLVSPITGVVNQLERNTSVGSGVHVYLAGHNFAFKHDNLRSLKAGLRSMSAGKGMSKSQAKASGLCEGIERYSGVYEGIEPRITASYDALGKKAIHPCDCMLYSKTQYKNRKAINAAGSKFNRVPEPFEDTSMEIEWSPVWSLTHDREKYLPTQYLYYGYRSPDKSIAPLYFSACSNGNASGNTLEEAILQGFFELVERDCVALWWYNMLQKPGVDISTFNESYFLELEAYYKTINRSVWVLDLTSDLDIPTFVALSGIQDQPEENIIFGFGSHLDAKSAVQRALTEMNQSLPFVKGLTKNKTSNAENFGDLDAMKWWKEATCDNQPYLVSDPDQDLKTAADYPSTHYTDILDEIQTCRSRVEELGMEMLVLDQTRPDLKVNVAKVIVPSLRHFWARFAQGRLYEVPVRMGWLDKTLTEEELNPIPIFI